ncbi:MAG: alanine racemase [Caulobacteraceae bacterium]
MLRPDIVAAGRLTIDLHKLVRNYEALGARVAPARLAAVVKANAYGLGATAVAEALETAGCRTFFVAHLSEALSLRRGLADHSEVFVLNGLAPGSEALCAEMGCIPVLNSLEQVSSWNDLGLALGQTLPAAIQLDSGMVRLGLSEEDTRQVAAAPEALAGIDLRLVMSHLACADNPAAEANHRQRRRFDEMANLLPPAPRSLSNSASALGPPAPHGDLVRAGIALYGGAALRDTPNPMQPVVRLEAAIIQVRTVPDGAGVGYGLMYTTKGVRRLATVSVGYADGWPRRLGGRGAVFVGGVRAPIVGQVSMDSMTIDVTAAPETALRPGAPVELIGEHQSLEQVAADAGAIGYEILALLGPRYTRIYCEARPRDAVTGAKS